jgi:hypothetical protein
LECEETRAPHARSGQCPSCDRRCWSGK